MHRREPNGLRRNGGNIQGRKIGCDNGKTNEIYGCSIGDAGVAGCSVGNQGQLAGCASQQTSCDSSCAKACKS